MLKQQSNFDWNEIPMILGVADVAKILRIGQASAYKLMVTPGFPSIKIGKLNKVYRDSLRVWLEDGGRCSNAYQS